ncbi:MAG TPA: hypothetical protein VEO54_17320 [Thermoanaerobaculia bacterium]|nr:hypothetical protein [Thermoanaerobaculia bacterium]
MLRILFSGLMAFIPNENGTEVTVLLLNANHYHTSDGAAMPPHKPAIIARGNCSGDCVDDDTTIASEFFRDQSAATALDSLAYALGNGSAWWISGSDLRVQKSSGAADLPALNIRRDLRGTVNGQPQIVPTTSSERADFSWIPKLSQLCGSGCTIDPDLLANVPPGIVAARFKIDSGDLYTHSLARIGSDVTPVSFKRLDGTGSTAAYVQAVTSWVGLDIPVTGTSVQIVETKHDGGNGRSMTLSPDASGKVEVAVVNLPPFVPPASANNESPQVGKHFEMYYELLQNPPDRAARLVPRAGAPSGTTVPQVSWTSVHPASAVDSVLLNRLRMEPGRSLYDRTLCPPLEP